MWELRNDAQAVVSDSELVLCVLAQDERYVFESKLQQGNGCPSDDDR